MVHESGISFPTLYALSSTGSLFKIFSKQYLMPKLTYLQYVAALSYYDIYLSSRASSLTCFACVKWQDMNALNMNILSETVLMYNRLPKSVSTATPGPNG